MSAIPTLPQHILRTIQTRANDTLDLKHDSQVHESAMHVEDVKQPHGLSHTNGAAAETQWTIRDSPVENQRPIKVIVIGAGYSGIYCGIRIPERIRNCELVIYEKNAGVGGKHLSIEHITLSVRC